MREGSGGARIRCAIYTRKSTEEGLDQAFNSLDAQREACEAYIKSQAGEGWRPLPDHYDDGGFSGGNMARPAIQRLLADVDAGKVDVIVVYKVDRLTRSLMDFARIVERLDARGVSFVSVTQAFNTTTSMGRLTLNVLLSFAQFEREVTGERIRDKVAASKAKGIWMGGNVPLGYDLQDRKLIINPAEAEKVRHIFSRYVSLRSAVVLVKELREEGIVSKRWTARSGRTMGGAPFRLGALYYILQNRLYLGEVIHRGKRHKGEHRAIVSEELFRAVQELLAENRREKGRRPTRVGACALAGCLFDGDGRSMTSSFSYGRGGKSYRYYVSPSVLPGSASPNLSDRIIRRVPAAALEKLVQQRLTRLLGASETMPWETLRRLLRRVELLERSIQLVLDPQCLLEPHEPLDRAVVRLRKTVHEDRLVREGDAVLRLICDQRPRFRGGKAGTMGKVSTEGGEPGELRDKLRQAHQLLKAHSMSPLAPERHPLAEAPPYQRERHLMATGLLSPSLQRRIAEGKIDQAFGAALLGGNLPLAWKDQAAVLDI